MTRQKLSRIYPIGGAWGGSACIRLEGAVGLLQSGVAMIVVAADSAETLEFSDTSKFRARGA
jgi:hypothetical protein